MMRLRVSHFTPFCEWLVSLLCLCVCVCVYSVGKPLLSAPTALDNVLAVLSDVIGTGGGAALPYGSSAGDGRCDLTATHTQSVQ
jgi:hypothetical protein